MDVYGLTGGIGSGKSTVANLLEDYGVPVVSADELSRIVVSPGSEGLAEVVAEFGKGVLDEHGGLDRAKLAAVVFADPDRRRRLEEILHPRIRERYEQVLDAMEKAGHEVAIYEVPLLFEKNLQGEMKATLLVTAPDAVRVRRVCARDDITETEVRARIAAQMPEEQKRRRADYIIENDGNLDALRREVEFLLARFLRVSGVARRGPASQEVVASPSEVDDGPSLPHTLPHLPMDPSRARTEIPTRAPVRTGQTLPPGMSHSPPPASAHADPSPDATLPAAAVVAAVPITVEPTGSGPVAVPPALSEPIAVPQAPAPPRGPRDAAHPHVASSSVTQVPSSSVTQVPSSAATPVSSSAATQVPSAAPPEVAEPAPAQAAAQALSTPPKAPPLRKPTGDPAPKAAGPPKAPKSNPTIKAPPLRPPTKPPGNPVKPAGPAAKPPPPPPAPPGEAKPPAPPNAEGPKPPRPAPRTKTLVTPPTPPVPPAAAPRPTPPRGQTERVTVVSPQAPPVDEDAS